MKSQVAAFWIIVSVMSQSADAQAQGGPAKPEASQQQGMMMQGHAMRGGMMQGEMTRGRMMEGAAGMNVMAVTVTSLDEKTGVVNVSNGKLQLILHFPPASLAGVKAGDKLSVHMGFTKS